MFLVEVVRGLGSDVGIAIQRWS